MTDGTPADDSTAPSAEPPFVADALSPAPDLQADPALESLIDIPVQEALLLETEMNIANNAKRRKNKPIIVHADEAQLIAEIPHEVMYDIGELAIKRVRMRGDTHLQASDVDAAYAFLITRPRTARRDIIITIGGFLAGLGVPIALGPLVLEGQRLTTAGFLIGFGLSLVGGMMVCGVIGVQRATQSLDDKRWPSMAKRYQALPAKRRRPGRLLGRAVGCCVGRRQRDLPQRHVAADRRGRTARSAGRCGLKRPSQ